METNQKNRDAARAAKLKAMKQRVSDKEKQQTPKRNAQPPARRQAAPASNAQRRPVQPQNRTAQQGSVQRRPASQTAARRSKTKKNKSLLGLKLPQLGVKQSASGRDRREEAARAAKLKAMKQEINSREKQQTSKRKVRKPRRPSTPVIYTQPRTFNAHRLILQLVSVLAVVMALILGLSIFFRVEVIEVSGANVYTEWAVREASGIQEGDYLMTFSRARAGGKIYAELTYVDHVRFGIKLPNTVIIDIDELDVVYAIQSSDGIWYLMSSEGKIVEQTDGGNAGNYTKVEGVTLKDPIVGEQAIADEGIAPAPADSSEETAGTTGETTPQLVVTAANRLTTALQILQALEGNGIVGEAASVDVGDLDHIELWYGSRYQVNLGSADDMGVKIAAMNSTILELAEYQTGELDISFTIWPDKVVYTPFE